MELKQFDIVLCEFYFSDFNKTKKRPVLVFKDNLPYNDFIAIPISSKIDNLKEDEMIIENSDFIVGNIKKLQR
ncbi:MAG: type II toxin-antitoxin system PemK/MazF family toxin [Campylobacterota bacterium]|nr:type II toxin-antitoxin system PemK/MazF family toxin [Campylobacterota bacterium]